MQNLQTAEETPLPPQAPYKYLSHYGLGDRDIFRGREREVRALVTDVTVNRLVVLFAETGTGKTSLINAGVRPRLEGWPTGDRLPMAEREYATFYIRVKEDPAASIQTALAAYPAMAGLPADGSLEPPLRKVVEEVDRPLVLFLDQFEEFFLYRDPAHSRRKRQFIEDVAALYRNRDSGVHMAFSMREEFLGKMDAFRELIPTIYHKDAQLRLGWFAPDQAREAIALPPEQVGVKVHGELVEAVLADLATDEGVEPAQLQIVCDSLWAMRAPEDRELTPDHYRRLGGGEDEVKLAQAAALEDSFARKVLGRRFEADIQGLTRKPALDTLAALLPELCTPEGTKRIRDVSGLASIPGVDPSCIPDVVEYLARTRLVQSFQRDSVTYIELAHDYLVKRMPALQARVRTLRAREFLASGMTAFRDSHALIPAERLEEIYRSTAELDLSADQARMLLLSALEWGHQLPFWFRGAASRGVDVWAAIREALDSTDAASIHVAQAAVYLLADLKSDEALPLLEKALADEGLAPTVIDALPELQSLQAVEMLAGQIRGGRFVEESRVALQRLASKRLPEVAEAARAVLIEIQPLRTSRRGLADGAGYGAGTASGAGFADGSSIGGGEPPVVPSETSFSTRTTGGISGVSPLPERDSSAPSSPPSASSPAAAGPSVEEPALTKESQTAGTPEPYASPTPPPYSYIARLFMEGAVIPFLGSGVNLATRPPHAEWEPGAPFLPSGSELSAYLAQLVQYPLEPDGSARDFVRVASYVQEILGRQELIDLMREAAQSPAEPGPVHRFLAAGPAPMLILTTNYDSLLERSFDEAGRPYDVVAHLLGETDYASAVQLWRSGEESPEICAPSQLTVDPRERTVIYKLAGSFFRQSANHDSLVLTEDDCIEQLTEVMGRQTAIPAVFLQHVRSRPLLYMGIGLDHWYLRALVRSLMGGTGRSRSRSWAILHNPSPVTGRLWENQGVQVHNLRAEEFVQNLKLEVSPL